MSQKQVVMRPGGTPKYTTDAATNDSDKTFTVPAGKVWDMRHIYVKLVNTATVGNRNLVMQISDGTTIFVYRYDTAVSTASQTSELEVSFMGGAAAAAVIATGVRHTVLPISPLILPAAYTIRIWDANAIDAAADDLTVVLHYIEYEA